MPLGFSSTSDKRWLIFRTWFLAPSLPSGFELVGPDLIAYKVSFMQAQELSWGCYLLER